MFTRMLRRLWTLVLGVGGLALVAPSIAGANPACNTLLHSSVTLSSDMVCNSSDALRVGAPGITINLNGFTIRETSGSGWEGVNNSSVQMDGGFANVTLENGTITGFETGIYFADTHGATIKNVKALNNGDGIDFTSLDDSVLEHSVADGNYDGIELGNNHLDKVTNTKANYNSNAGISDFASVDMLNADTANHNGRWGVFVEYPFTFSTSTGQVYWTISHSTANYNAKAGFRVEKNSPGSSPPPQANLFDNTAEFNSGWGYFADSQAKSNKTNGAKGNSAGNCHHVKCHTIP